MQCSVVVLVSCCLVLPLLKGRLEEKSDEVQVLDLVDLLVLSQDPGLASGC